MSFTETRVLLDSVPISRENKTGRNFTGFFYRDGLTCNLFLVSVGLMCVFGKHFFSEKNVSGFGFCRVSRDMTGILHSFGNEYTKTIREFFILCVLERMRLF